MKILIVEHDEPQRLAMAVALQTDGHELFYANGCGEASRKFAKIDPDLVLMDIALSDCDGYQCTQRIRSLAGERLVPVILSTSVDDHMSFRRFIESGAADFIDEPTDPFVLRAKVSGHARTRELYRHLKESREKFYREVTFAKNMFDAVLRRKPLATQGLQYWTVTAGHFCGNLMIHEETPDGRMNIMLGDFIGYGLSAAMGAMPVSDAFFAMSRKGLPIGEIAAEINRKLHYHLPAGHYCAATIASLDVRRAELEVWMGGQPPVLLVDGQGRVVDRLVSENAPLGIVGEREFDATTRRAALATCSHLLLYSDGLVAARNADGEAFGEERLMLALNGPGRATQGGLMQSIKSRLVSFLSGLEPHADVSVLAVDLAATAPQAA